MKFRDRLNEPHKKAPQPKAKGDSTKGYHILTPLFILFLSMD